MNEEGRKTKGQRIIRSSVGRVALWAHFWCTHAPYLRPVGTPSSRIPVRLAAGSSALGSTFHLQQHSMSYNYSVGAAPPSGGGGGGHSHHGALAISSASSSSAAVPAAAAPSQSSQYSPTSTLERQYVAPVGRRLTVLVRANPACLVEGGVEAVLRAGRNQQGNAAAGSLPPSIAVTATATRLSASPRGT